MINLENKIAIVTGAGRGLGRRIAVKLAELNAYVIAADINESDLEETVDLIKKNSNKGEYFVCDVTDKEKANLLIQETYKHHGSLDILVNNAGINKDAMLHKMTSNQWEDVLNVNLTGVFNTMSPASKIMREEEKGSIINISSIAWLGNIGQANYSASKAGVVGLTKTAARELGKKNVTVNAIAPGFIDTEMTRGVPEKVWDLNISKIPLGREGKPEDVANCIAFLASDQANYITGELINVGGGMVI